jgi:hypothetical protein
VSPGFSLGYTQYSDSANISASIAGYNVSAPLDFYPFTEGGGNYGGNYTRLGGTGVLNNSGNIFFNISDTGLSIANNGVSGPAWEQSQEQFEFAASVLSYIPVTSAAGAALYAVQSAADLDLMFNVYGNIGRTDIVNLNVASLPYIEVPASLAVGDTWDLSTLPIEVIVPYYFNTQSSFYYELGMNITFDARLIDEVEIIGWDDILAVAAGSGISSYLQDNFSFIINNGSVPVVAKDSYLGREALLYDSELFLLGVDQEITEASPYQHMIPEGLQVATYDDLNRSVHEYERVPEPATMLLLGCGLLGLWGLKRKFKN